MKTAEEKLKELTEDYVNNKVDFNIRAFQKTEVPALMDLANDSFDAGYRKALAEHDAEIIKIIDEMIDDSDYRDISQLYHIGKREALTELKAKLWNYAQRKCIKYLYAQSMRVLLIF